MSATAALRAFCKDEDLFGGVWGQRSQTRVSLQGTEPCLCDSVDVRINCEVQDHALWSLPAWCTTSPQRPELKPAEGSGSLSILSMEMQLNFHVKKNWSLSISFPSFRSCFSQASPGMDAFFSLPRKAHQAEAANPSLWTHEHPHKCAIIAGLWNNAGRF